MAARWADAGVDRLDRRLESVERHGPLTVVRSTYTTAAGIAVSHEVTYTPLADGGIAVEETAELPETLADLARVGTVLELVPGLEASAGSGPGRTRRTRIASAAASSAAGNRP